MGRKRRRGREKTEEDELVMDDECVRKYEEEGESGRGMGGEVDTDRRMSRRRVRWGRREGGLNSQLTCWEQRGRKIVQILLWYKIKAEVLQQHWFVATVYCRVILYFLLLTVQRTFYSPTFLVFFFAFSPSVVLCASLHYYSRDHLSLKLCDWWMERFSWLYCWLEFRIFVGGALFFGWQL